MPTNEEIIRQVYEAAEASVRDTEKFISLFAEDGYFLDVPSGTRWVGSDVGQPVEALFVAFPDMHRELLKIHGSGEVVVVELRLQGTHKGDFHIAGGVLPATGRTFDAPCCDVFRLKDGKVTEFRCYNDVSTWLDNLGALHDLDTQLRR